jgi:ribosomal protein S12 methylthiotransferase
MPSVALFNLGCSKNIVDGERILHLVQHAGYTVTETVASADLVIVNTCAFIREAQEEAIETILSAAHMKSEHTKLIVSGCFSERFRAQVASKFPEVDVWIGVSDWETILCNLLKTNISSSFERILSEPYATQYIKIADGCSHHCSFCVIPAIRGPYTSREAQSILSEVQWLESQGVRELILVAQDSSFYGRDTGSSLVKLLDRILTSCTIPWIRMMYLHPQYIDDEFLRFVAAEKRICRYFDLPLQHIAEPILRSMKRTPLTKDIYLLVERIRAVVPGAAIRSAFICGYPGETEKEFNELLHFVEWAKFDRLGVFPFSPEEGTAAASFPHRPRTGTALRRCETIMLAQRDISREANERRIGSTIEAIIDSVAQDPDFNFEARSRFDAPEVDGKILLRNGSFDIGEIIQVKVIGASDYDLFAEFTV